MLGILLRGKRRVRRWWWLSGKRMRCRFRRRFLRRCSRRRMGSLRRCRMWLVVVETMAASHSWGLGGMWRCFCLAGVAEEEAAGVEAGLVEEVGVAEDVAEAEFGGAGLSAAEELA